MMMMMGMMIITNDALADAWWRPLHVTYNIQQCPVLRVVVAILLLTHCFWRFSNPQHAEVYSRYLRNVSSAADLSLGCVSVFANVYTSNRSHQTTSETAGIRCGKLLFWLASDDVYLMLFAYGMNDKWASRCRSLRITVIWVVNWIFRNKLSHTALNELWKWDCILCAIYI